MPELHSRRRFLRRSAAFAAGACTSMALAGDVNGSAASRLKVGIVGNSEQARVLANVIRESGAELVAHCEADTPQAAEVQVLQPAAVAFDNAWSLVDQAPLDAVVLADGVADAAGIARIALQRGRHVYSMPLGGSIAESRDIGELAFQSGLLTQVHLRSAGQEGVQHIVEPLRSGAIGRIREVVCWSSCDNGRGFQAQGHRVLSLPASILGLEHPTSIFAAGTTPPGAEFPRGLAVRYEFDRRGDQPSLRVTWYNGTWAPPYESVDGIPLSACGALYLGESGQLLDDPGTGQAALLRDGQRPCQLAARAVPDHQLLRNWLAACAGEPRPLTGLPSSAILNQTILAGLVAYRVQQRLDWDGPAMRAANCRQADALIRSSAETIGLA